MKILIVGNSQSGCLKKALDASISNQFPLTEKADWIVIPGGTGPYASIQNGKVKINTEDPKSPPRFHPDMNILKKDIASYDVIFISALGYVDGGFYYYNDISADEKYPMASVNHKKTIRSYPLSEACYRDIVFNKLDKQAGMIFFNRLKKCVKAKILIQPFPLLSAAIMGNKEWYLNKIYNDKLSANKEIIKFKQLYLERICNQNNTYLLPYPREEWEQKGFSPEEYMTGDMLHPNEKYGELVLTQFENFLNYSIKI